VAVIVFERMAFDIPGREVVVVRADVLAMAESSEVNVCDTTSKQMGENVLGKRTLIYLYGRDPLLTELDGNIFYLVVIEVLAKASYPSLYVLHLNGFAIAYEDAVSFFCENARETGSSCV
jgi:hypothetical protein